tara:strand:+ start:2065 stop:2697 length:633 start_codon:yes stop_codon:yes gene_type:complete
MTIICKSKIKSSITEIINELDLEPKQQKILQRRYLKELRLYSHKAKVTEFFYIFLSIFVTIATIILPALLSIQQIDYSDDKEEDDEFKKKVYWATWVISLLVTISNGLVQFLNLHNQFVSYNQTKEKMLSEGWYYFQLSGNYKNKTHKTGFIDFCEEIENIKKNQVEKELMFISVGDNKDKIENEIIKDTEINNENIELIINKDKKFSTV